MDKYKVYAWLTVLLTIVVIAVAGVWLPYYIMERLDHKYHILLPDANPAWVWFVGLCGLATFVYAFYGIYEALKSFQRKIYERITRGR